MTNSEKQPLSGMRVVDLTWVLAGPMATKMLALMGAEVIKVESSLRPEYVRREGHFRVVNNNKRSCTINITKPEGQKLLRQLTARSNILVENFSHTVLQKYGLSYEEMKKQRSDLIFVSGSGLGRAGPQRDALAYGTLLQAYSGRAQMIGKFNARLEGMGVTGWTDPMTATWEALAILAAIYHWQETGSGSFVDLSMLECIVSLLPDTLFREIFSMCSEGTGGNQDIGAAPSGCFRCAGHDQWIAISVRSEAQWQGLCSAMQRQDLLSESRFADGLLRDRHKSELDRIVAAWTRTRSSHETENELLAAGVPAAHSQSTAEVMADPHLLGRGVFPELADGTRTTGLAWRDADGWAPSLTPPPTLGEDNDYVFGELLGLSMTRIKELAADEVIR